ncbi:MAG TPA: DivIVA domain-containing protein [Deferrisomatales bacterium]|nr:DivIVA domain-containing protein [Deferrisomatales bacterium]
MRITPLDVHEQTFRVTFRGFDPAEVDAFLQRVADELERLVEERDQLQAKLDKERETRGNLEETLSSARTLQQGVLEQAKQEAALRVSQAQLKADRILARANEELVTLRRESQVLIEKRNLWLGELAALAGTLQDWTEHKRRQPFVSLELIASYVDDTEPSEPDPAQAGGLADALEALDDSDEGAVGGQGEDADDAG